MNGYWLKQKSSKKVSGHNAEATTEYPDEVKMSFREKHQKSSKDMPPSHHPWKIPVAYLRDGGIVNLLCKHWTSIIGVIDSKCPSVDELQWKKTLMWNSSSLLVSFNHLFLVQLYNAEWNPKIFHFYLSSATHQTSFIFKHFTHLWVFTINVVIQHATSLKDTNTENLWSARDWYTALNLAF